MSLGEKLFLFFMIFQVSENGMGYLLSILKDEGLDVPSSVYKLKKFQNKQKIQLVKDSMICGGKLAYLSIAENLKYCILNNLCTFKKYVSLSIKIGIDGIPIFKSSPVSLWPILMIIDKKSFQKPLPIAVYVGVGKPNFDEFLEYLVQELDKFKNYVLINGIYFKIDKIIFIADSPARTFLTGCKSHSGYSSCLYCRIKGVYSNKKVVFPFSQDMISRSDEEYTHMNENNQIKLSPLAKFCSLKDSFPPEYMHSVCLGVMRRLLNCYFTSNHGLYPCRLNNSMKLQLDERISFFGNSLPYEFQRKIRSFSNLSEVFCLK